jgi:hypothetical protein
MCGQIRSRVVPAKVCTFSYLVPFNFTGAPAVVVRAGAEASGLPIGVQCVAQPWLEVCRIARERGPSLSAFWPITGHNRPMATDGPSDLQARESVRLALKGWQQRVQAVIEIARDSDDLAVRLPVLDELARELVIDITHAINGIDAARHAPGAVLPIGSDVLRDTLGKSHTLLAGIELWHRAPSVAALRKARDYFGVAAERFPADGSSD